MLRGKHSENSFHQPLPNLKIVVFLFILKCPEWHKASCLQELTLPKGEKISLCFNESRGVEDVNQTDIQIAIWFPKARAYESCIIPCENKLIDSKWEKVITQNLKCFTSTFSIQVTFVVLKISNTCGPDKWRSWDLFLSTLEVTCQ